jgi:hypothetical protein
MPVLIKIVRGRNKVEFDKGTFDEWCVFLSRPLQSRYAPKDTEYFSIINQLGLKHGKIRLYNDYCAFYRFTNKVVNDKTLNYISEIADSYGKDAEEIDIWFTVIYAGMVAEENKTNAVLGKRIKRLGMHQVLIEDMSADYAANFSKGKKWRELDALMRERGF